MPTGGSTLVPKSGMQTRWGGMRPGCGQRTRGGAEWCAGREHRRLNPPRPQQAPEATTELASAAAEPAVVPTGTDVELPISPAGDSAAQVLLVGDNNSTDFELKMTPAQMAEVSAKFRAKPDDEVAGPVSPAHSQVATTEAAQHTDQPRPALDPPQPAT